MVLSHAAKEKSGGMLLHHFRKEKALVYPPFLRRESAMLYPPALAKGDCIGLAAPASPISNEERDACVQVLEELGFGVKLASGLLGNVRTGPFPYLAGTARQRAEDLNQMFYDRQVQAVFCVRGGYGSAGILPWLDYRGIRRNPKIFVGYSDITAVHMALQRHSGLVTFHGPMVKSDLMKKESRACDWKSLWNMIGKEGQMFQKGRAVFQNPDGEEIGVYRSGEKKITGRLAGGNLSVLAKLAGTGYLPDMKNKILFLEDINESTARIHMNLIQLQQMGIFGQVRGILLGDFTDCGSRTKELLAWFFQEQGLPTLTNVCSDHRAGMGTLPLGAMCEIWPASGRIRFFR